MIHVVEAPSAVNNLAPACGVAEPVQIKFVLKCECSSCLIYKSPSNGFRPYPRILLQIHDSR